MVNGGELGFQRIPLGSDGGKLIAQANRTADELCVSLGVCVMDADVVAHLSPFTSASAVVRCCHVAKAIFQSCEFSLSVVESLTTYWHF